MMTSRSELREKLAHRLAAWHNDFPPTTVHPAWLVDMYREAADAVMPIIADVWDEGARWAAVECGAITDERNMFVAPGENPYRGS